MTRRAQPTRRRNIARTIAALRRGTPDLAPCQSGKWARWGAGLRAAAIRGKKIAADLDRRPAGPPLDLAGRCPTPARFKRQLRARQDREAR